MKKTSSFLTGFLAMLVAAGLLSYAGTAQARLITINVGAWPGYNIGGINGGVGSGNARYVYDFPRVGNDLWILNNQTDGYGTFDTGLAPGAGIQFATGSSPATPTKFSLGQSISSAATWQGNQASDWYKSLFSDKDSGNISPDFGPISGNGNGHEGSYMGFKTSQGNYGWLEVRWDSASKNFQILNGAWESQAGIAINAGAGVPEPGTWAAAALLAGGAGFMRWRKRAKVA